jgi:hypothetical protein
MLRRLAPLLALVLAGCASESTTPTSTSLKPLPVVMTQTTTTVGPAAVPTTVPPVADTAPLLDVYGNPIDDSVTYTVAPPAGTTAPPRTAPPKTGPGPTQPPTSQSPVCHKKKRKHCPP